MKRFWASLAAALTRIGLPAAIAEARPFGEGGSSGKQPVMPPQQAQKQLRDDNARLPAGVQQVALH